jgi:hypothetical protein
MRETADQQERNEREGERRKEEEPESNHVLCTCVPSAPAAPAPYTGLGPT